MLDMVVAMAAFVGSHFLLSSRWVRPSLARGMGERGYIVFYSLVAASALTGVIVTYRAAPYIEVWFSSTGVKHTALTVVLLSAILIAAAISPNNPAVAGAPPPKFEDGPKGIFRITRHPFMWGVALWALVHMAANGDAASLVLFGGFAVLALAGPMHTDARKRRLHGAAWETYARQSSHLPFLAVAQGRTRLVWPEIGWRPVIVGFVLYLVLLIFHEPVIGIAPLSLVSGFFG